MEVNPNYNLPKRAPDKYVAAGPKIPAGGTPISLSQIPNNLIPDGTTSRNAIGRKTFILTKTLKATAKITRTPSKITIEIPFKDYHTVIDIETADENQVKVKMTQNKKSIGELTGELTINDKDGSINVINKEKSKFIKVTPKPNGDIEITNNCFDPGVKLTFEAQK